MNILTEFGFNSIDIKMLLLCPFFTTIGGPAHILMVSCDLSNWPVIRLSPELELSSGNWREKINELTVFMLKRVLVVPVVLIHSPYWIVARLALSALKDLVVGLYFVGSFPTPSPEGGLSTGVGADQISPYVYLLVM